MRRLRELIERLLRDAGPAALAPLLSLVVVVAAVVLLGPCGRSSTQPAQTPRPLNPAPSPVLTPPSEISPTAPPRGLFVSELIAARSAARAFLDSYLPALYGRRPLDAVGHSTVHLRRSLRGAWRPGRELRRRRPRVTVLTVQAQGPRSVVASATVDDGVVPAFRLIFTVELVSGRWLASDLASD